MGDEEERLDDDGDGIGLGHGLYVRFTPGPCRMRASYELRRGVCLVRSC